MKHYEIINGDTLEQTKKLENKSVDCVITSPPYWQLRDYGYPEQWGLEPTYHEYLEHLWGLMDVLWDKLKDGGTCWINLGDTYWTAKGTCKNPGGNSISLEHSKKQSKVYSLNRGNKTDNPDLPQKTLTLIPHRFAIGCIDRGWILRNDVIWAKRNGMPESVTDRFSKKHEFIFFFVKQQKYYFDLSSIRQPLKESSVKRLSQNIEAQEGSSRVPFKTNGKMKAVRFGGNKGDGFDYHTIYSGKEWDPKHSGANPGDVSDFWDIPTKPSSAKHYATFNSDLIDKPIIAGSPEGGIILDPFCGTGTTLIRAVQLGRRAIGIDGKKEYCDMAEERIEQTLGLFKEVV